MGVHATVAKKYSYAIRAGANSLAVVPQLAPARFEVGRLVHNPELVVLGIRLIHETGRMLTVQS